MLMRRTYITKSREKHNNNIIITIELEDMSQVKEIRKIFQKTFRALKHLLEHKVGYMLIITEREDLS